MIDLHAHVLPGIDDGAATLADAVAMCRIAADDGIEILAATPHQRHESWENDDPSALATLLAEVQEAAGPRPRLLLGAEIRVDSELLSAVDLLPKGSLLPLAGSRYLLLEFPPQPYGPEPREIVHEILLTGRVPILAHPERIPWMADDPELLFGLVERGALLQLTAMSVTGRFGRKPQASAQLLLREGVVAVVASDAHNATSRPPRLSEAFRAVTESWGEQAARRMFVDNPAAILQDLPLPA